MAMRSLSIAASGAAALQNEIDVISNNLANVNTTAFKKTRVNFADLFSQQIRPAGSGQPGINQDPTGIQLGTGVRTVGTQKVFQQGALEITDNDFDMAIDGDGFFRVILPDGTTSFTRAGSFRIDSSGQLVTGDGYKVEPEITIPENITRITVDTTGLIFGLDPQNPQQQQQLGQLELTRFINPSGLEAVGDNLYKETPASGNRIDGIPTQQGMGSIRHRFLESSNVDVVKELVSLITAQRSFEINSKSIQTADEMLQTVNNLRR